MPLGLIILLLLITSYFLAAAIFPRLRVRWGAGVGASLTVSREGVERSRYKFTKARMGAVSCLGFATFVGAFPVGALVPRTPVLYIVSAGFILMAIGALLDWLREPPKYTKR